MRPGGWSAHASWPHRDGQTAAEFDREQKKRAPGAEGMDVNIATANAKVLKLRWNEILGNSVVRNCGSLRIELRRIEHPPNIGCIVGLRRGYGQIMA
jgi:hypothetical protein